MCLAANENKKVTVLIDLDSRRRDSARALADRVWRWRSADDLAPGLPWWLDSVCENRSTAMAAGSRCPSGISTEIHSVRRLRHFSCWRHCKPIRSVPTVCWWHAARLAMRTDNTSAGLSVRMYCRRQTVACVITYIGLQRNRDKSETLIVRSAHPLRAATWTVSSVTVADVDMPLANKIKLLTVIKVVLNRRLRQRKFIF